MILVGQSLRFKKDRWGKQERYLDKAVERELPPTLFVTGKENHVFPDSHSKTFKALSQTQTGKQHELWEVPGYGHQDIFMGKNCHREIFPRYIEFLKKHNN